ncbi:amino acid aminotransferase [Ferrimonas kyonanensis]|uniref:amino acid aminotransferase n=1 Tax=Ferrimonas kyonanensis TaxID=364763 RepID=UPI00040BB831|nr:amino acid aminotransferase [Ferrimonas kyonanensis]
MFESIPQAPADPILGLNEAFKTDPRASKVNLGVGVYKDAQGTTPVLRCVKLAEAKILEQQKTKSYLSIDGLPEYAAAVQALLFGADSDIIATQRARTAQAPGGTGALRVAADFIFSNLDTRKVWISNPSWANHAQIFQAVGFEVAQYRYYDADAKGLDFEGMKADLAEVEAGDVVILHGCCHNPSGIDPTAEQWSELAAIACSKGWLPLFDFAYQGFAVDVEQDATGLRLFADAMEELMVASSFSKNFGLYNERTGAFTLLAQTSEAANSAFSQVKKVIRANYSNPPAHGAMVVATILADAELKAMWLEELAEMRARIKTMRLEFVSQLKAAGVAGDFSFIEQQNGMFSFSGLNPDQVAALKEEFAIYIVRSGRINVAGMTEANLPYLVSAIASVI